MRFDVHRRGREARVLLLDCQADTLSYLRSRLIVPLVTPSDLPERVDRLNPVFVIEGQERVMVTQAAAAVPVRQLGPVVASLAEHDIAIGNALDMLLSGF